MRNKIITRFLSVILALGLSAAMFTTTAFTGGGDEEGDVIPTDPIGEVVSEPDPRLCRKATVWGFSPTSEMNASPRGGAFLQECVLFCNSPSSNGKYSLTEKSRNFNTFQ